MRVTTLSSDIFQPLVPRNSRGTSGTSAITASAPQRGAQIIRAGGRVRKRLRSHLARRHAFVWNQIRQHRRVLELDDKHSSRRLLGELSPESSADTSRCGRYECLAGSAQMTTPEAGARCSRRMFDVFGDRRGLAAASSGDVVADCIRCRTLDCAAAAGMRAGAGVHPQATAGIADECEDEGQILYSACGADQ